jgi:predicted site-specific integrase-resolvase
MDDREPELMTVKQTCWALGVTRNTLYRWRCAGHLVPVNIGPPGAKRPVVRYKREDILKIQGGQYS